MIPIDKIEKTYDKIKEFITPTRLDKSFHLTVGDTEVYLKMESEHSIVKSFKIRGVLGKLSHIEQNIIQEVQTSAISSGNQGICLSYAANMLGLKKPIIFVPETTPENKIKKMEALGADVQKRGQNYDQVHNIAELEVEKEGYINIDAREDEEGVLGGASVGIEIIQQLPEVDVVIIPKGSGALATSNASYFKQRKAGVKVYAVEAESCPALTTNLKEGKWTKNFPITGTEEPLLKSLVGGCAELSYNNASTLEDILLVNDQEVKVALGEIFKKERVIVEPDSAAAYAAYKRYSHLFIGKKTVLVLTGGNIDDQLFKEIVNNNY